MEIDKSSLKKKSIISVAWKFSERILAKLVSVVVTIVLARLLSPEDYSVTGIVSIFFVFANVFITGGFNTALIQKKDSDIEDYSSVLYLSLFISLVMYVGLFFCSPYIAKAYDEEVLVPVIRIMGLILFINAFNAVASARVSSQLEFKRYFFATLGGTLISAFVGIMMALKGCGCWALVAQQMCNTTIDTLILMITSKFRVVFKISFKRLKGLFSFGWKIFVSNIISTLYDEINPLVIGLKYSNADLAFYTKGRSFPNILNTTVGDTFSTVFFPVASKLQDKPREMLNATRKFMRMSTFLIFPAMIGFFAVAKNFVLVLLTDKWLSATVYIQIFSIVFMFNIIQKGNLQVIQAVGRSDLILKMEILKKSIYFLVIGLFLFFTDKPEWLAIACLINTLIAAFINTFPNRKLIGYSYRLQILDILPNFVTSIIMGFIVMLVGTMKINCLLSLSLQIVSGIMSYILLNLITKNENLSYFLNTIKEIISKNR